MEASQESGQARSLKALVIGAIGVVFGDIGTSPLYTLREAFHGAHAMAPTPGNVLGILSLVFWAVMLVVSLKYVVFIMRADNRGEGGIMALMALASSSARNTKMTRWWIMILAILGASLFYGDGVITPAVSVLGAVEGLEVAAPALHAYIVPIAVVVLVGLFAFQRIGSEKVGIIFGPICCLWFVCIAGFGAAKIFERPDVLVALNPICAVDFFAAHGWKAFVALGAVVLALTGAEALYADMGHFGKRAIRLGWFGFVLPALMLNYFGQGALLLAYPEAATNPFYRLLPAWALYPMIVLATMAAVIASQAVISGAFSVTRQAIQLGFAPRTTQVHTSSQTIGQIYLPWVNRTMLIAIIAVVIGFQSSTNLAAAYGIAVTGTMAIDTVLALIVARRLWHWSRALVVTIGVVFLTIDLSFFGANAIKILQGGWFPLVLGIGIFTVMTTWKRGRQLLLTQMKTQSLALEPFIESISAHPPHRVPGTAVFMTANQEGVPHALLHNLKHNKVLHEKNVLLTVETLEIPRADAGERVELEALGHNFYKLTLRFGFAEDPNVPMAMSCCDAIGLPFDMMDTTFFVSRENVIATAARKGMPLWRDKLFVFMARNASPATAFFQIPGNRLIELGTQVEI